MHIGKLKNVTIIFLCVLAVYQTSMLWFDNISSHNFFYTLFAASNKSNLYDIEYDFTVPRDIIVGFGNENFNKLLISKDGRRLNDKIYECMKYMAANGEYIDKKEVDWNEILKSKSVICYYDINIQMSSYIKSMGGKSVQTFSNKLSDFDIIAIVPARTTGEYLKSYFINSDSNTAAIFSYKKNKASDNLYSAIEEVQKQPNNINYISTYQSGFSMFRDNIFLPQSANKDILYRPFKPINLLDKDNFTLQDIENTYIDNFFENPMAKWSRKDENGVFTFSDENIVVKYYPSGLLEYNNYTLNVNNNKDISFEAAFNSAFELIRQDRTLSQEEIYVSKAEHSNNIWTFGFNYYYNNFPIIMANELKQSLGIDNMIEIKVENGMAISYKRYIFEAEPLNTDKVVSINFSTILDTILSNKPNEIVDDMFLSYVLNGNDNYLDLKWIVDTSSKTYIEDTEIR